MADGNKYFNYNGVSSAEYGLVLSYVGAVDNYELGIDRSVISGDLNRFRTRVNSIGAKYEGVLSFSFGVIKDPCNYSDQQDGLFTKEDIRAVNKWLTSSSLPKILYFENTDGNNEDIYYFGTITSVENEVVFGGIYELTYTITCDSPFAFTDIKDEVFENTEAVWVNRVITVDSDDPEGYIYPIITITPHSTQDMVQIRNQTDGNSILKIKNVKKNSIITVNCQLQQIYDESGVLGLDDIGLSDESSIYIPRLVNGLNNIGCYGDATFTIQYRCPRKVGNA